MEASSEEEMPEEIQISVKKLDGDTFFINIDSNATVLALKNEINDQQTIAVNLQRLIYRAQELKDDFPISQYNIENESTLHLVIIRTLPEETGDTQQSIDATQQHRNPMQQRYEGNLDQHNNKSILSQQALKKYGFVVLLGRVVLWYYLSEPKSKEDSQRRNV